MKGRSRRREDQPDKAGRTTGNRGQRIDTAGAKGVVVIPQGVATSPAFVDLSPLAVKVLVVIQSHWNGFNNGRLHLSTRLMHASCGTSDNKSQARAVRELVDHGFVEITSGSDFNRKRLAREFRITYIAAEVGGASIPPTSDFRSWRRNETKETIAVVSHAGNDAIAGVSHAGAETTAMVSPSMASASPRSAVTSPALVSPALIYGHHTAKRPGRHDTEWLRRSAAKMLAGAKRGTQGVLAAEIGVSPARLSRLLNHGSALPATAADRLAGILNNGVSRRRYAGASA